MDLIVFVLNINVNFKMFRKRAEEREEERQRKKSYYRQIAGKNRPIYLKLALLVNYFTNYLSCFKFL